MKCINCGWENPPGAATCEKCRADLPAANSDSIPVFQNDDPEMAERPLRDYANLAPVICSNCGYPLSPKMTKCPNCDNITFGEKPAVARFCPDCGSATDDSDNFCRKCGAKLTSDSHFRKIQSSKLSTLSVSPFGSKAYFTLRRLPADTNAPKNKPVTFSGEAVELNGVNLDAHDPTINPVIHALVNCFNKKWTISGVRPDNVCYLRVNRPIELADGDTIVLGNTAFEFKCFNDEDL